MEIVRVARQTQSTGTAVSARCPACRKNATFDDLGRDIAVALRGEQHVVAGQRRCPDPQCHAHLFFIARGGELLVTYPPETIDFDPSHLPDGVLGALEEAIICHANGAYFAAAIMVRKTLEELSLDRNAKGHNLKQKLEALPSEVTLAPGLVAGLHDLRLLGNDAAHPESRHYETVDEEVVEIALGLTKQVLQAVYQSSYWRDRLEALKKAE